MDHDQAKENWSQRTNRYPGCTCPPWRYNPQHPAPTNPNCPTHGNKTPTQKHLTPTPSSK